jgi:hypothetical protein
MALKYGDVVVKVQKVNGKDGTVTVSRVNAIVLASSLKQGLRADRKPLTDTAGKKLAPVEHIDLAFPDPGLVPEGQTLKTRNVDSIFRLAYDVKPWEKDAQIGYELPGTVAVTRPPVPRRELPSAEDLDRDAAERAAAAVTQGE